LHPLKPLQPMPPLTGVCVHFHSMFVCPPLSPAHTHPLTCTHTPSHLHTHTHPLTCTHTPSHLHALRPVVVPYGHGMAGRIGRPHLTPCRRCRGRQSRESRGQQGRECRGRQGREERVRANEAQGTGSKYGIQTSSVSANKGQGLHRVHAMVRAVRGGGGG
jgi:hypothetical protein